MDDDIDKQLRHLDEVNDIINKLKGSDDLDEVEREKIVSKGKALIIKHMEAILELFSGSNIEKKR